MLKLRLLQITLLTALTIPTFAQSADIAVLGGGGFTAGEEQDTHGGTAVGATIGLPYSGRHRVQFDYLLNRVYTSGSENRHFMTASYLIQARAGRTRPFFQIGAGVVVRTFEPFFVGAPGFERSIELPSDTSFAVVLGGGATIDIGHSLFIRPQLRLYGHVGPTLTLLPSVGFGYRF